MELHALTLVVRFYELLVWPCATKDTHQDSSSRRDKFDLRLLGLTSNFQRQNTLFFIGLCALIRKQVLLDACGHVHAHGSELVTVVITTTKNILSESDTHDISDGQNVL